MGEAMRETWNSPAICALLPETKWLIDVLNLAAAQKQPVTDFPCRCGRRATALEH